MTQESGLSTLSHFLRSFGHMDWEEHLLEIKHFDQVASITG